MKVERKEKEREPAEMGTPALVPSFRRTSRGIVESQSEWKGGRLWNLLQPLGPLLMGQRGGHSVLEDAPDGKPGRL